MSTEANSPCGSALSEGLGPTPPAAALMRSRYVTTWAHAAVDGKNHFSEWGDWTPTTYAHAKAVTDPARNSDPVIYEMRPLYLKPPQLTAQQLDKMIEAHVGGADLHDGEYSAMVMFAAAVERAHGIGA